MQLNFQAPEVKGKTGYELKKAVSDSAGTADLKSIGLIAIYLLTGTTGYTSQDLSESGWYCSEEMVLFIKKTEDENPYQRLNADALLRLPLFNKDRL